MKHPNFIEIIRGLIDAPVESDYQLPEAFLCENDVIAPSALLRL